MSKIRVTVRVKASPNEYVHILDTIDKTECGANVNDYWQPTPILTLSNACMRCIVTFSNKYDSDL